MADPLYTTAHLDKPADASFDKEWADAPIEFIEKYLCHWEGEFAGEPFKLLDWEKDWIREVFGWRVDDHRLYRSAFLFVPSGNGKTELAAALANYLLLADGEFGAQVIGMASTAKQAGWCFERAKMMASMSDYGPGKGHSDEVEVYRQPNRIHHPRSNSTYSTISKEAKGAWGALPSAVIADELHVIDRELWQAVAKMAGKRKNCLRIAISTAGMGDVSRHSVAYEQWELIRKLAEGEERTDPTMFGCIYGAPDNSEWDDEKVWYDANPSLGVTLDIEVFRNEVEEAKKVPTAIPVFRTMRLNQWTEASTATLFDLSAWDASAGEVDEDALIGRECYVGLDLAKNVDLAAMAFTFPEPDGGATVVMRFFAPEFDLVGKQQREKLPYLSWRDNKHLITCPGRSISDDMILDEFHRLAEKYKVKSVSYDPWGSRYIVNKLEAEGVECVTTRQGHQTLTAPTNLAIKMVLDAKLRHGGHPILRSNAVACVGRYDQNGNVIPDREKSRGHIDGIAAMVNSLNPISRVVEKPKKSVYVGFA